MIDLHSHTFFSDGELVPSEHLRRVEAMGYEAMAITDHADSSNLDFIIPRIVRAAADWNRHSTTRMIAGIELTHVQPPLIARLTAQARELGAQLVVVHGETIVEPVAPGTNLAAIEAQVDILAHPGLISTEEMELAAVRGVFIEISGRKGHCLTNGHIVRLAAVSGADLVLDSDAHGPDDFMTQERADNIACGAGLTPQGLEEIHRNLKRLAARSIASAP
ncbi:histidinol phosphate phosphatase domain-containing protein [Desulfobacterota bacterium M19]